MGWSINAMLFTRTEFDLHHKETMNIAAESDSNAVVCECILPSAIDVDESIGARRVV